MNALNAQRCAWTPERLWRRAGVGAVVYAGAARADLPRLVLLALMGAFFGALSVEFGAGPRRVPSSIDAAHPFVPLVVGLLALPLLATGLAFVFGRVYGVHANAALLAAALRIAVLGVLPLDAAVACYPLPFGGAVVAAGALVSVGVWSSGCRALVGASRAGGAQCFALTLLAAAATVPMAGALLATLA